MTTFDKREEGFEKKYALDEELKFKAEARRNRLLGQWAAEKLGITGDADVLRKIRKDFDARGVDLTDNEIRQKMEQFFAEAVAQVKAGT